MKPVQRGISRLTMESVDLVRFWAIAVLASLPASASARWELIHSSFEIVQKACRAMFLVVPDYAKQCKASIQIIASVLRTVQHHLMQGSPAGPVQLVQAYMPISCYTGRYTGPAMRTLIMHSGHRKVFREVRNGLWELRDHAKMFEQPELEGSQNVLRDFMAFAEDVLYTCRALHQEPLAARTLQEEIPRQTPDALD